MEETIGKVNLRDVAIGTGIAVDKMLALTGQASVIAVQVSVPAEEERLERRARHARLDEITAKLKELRDSQA